MDIRNILGKLDQLTEGTMSSAKSKPTGPKFTGKMKGTDPASAAKDKYVGGMEESIFKELEATLQNRPNRDLMKEFKEFNKQGVAETKAATASFRASNAKRANVNAMTDDERRAYDQEKQEKQRKRDDARLERERQKNAAKKGVVKESSDIERKIHRTQQLIQDYYNRSRQTKNDINRDHYIDMARQLEYELEGMINDANRAEQDSWEVERHDAEPSATWNRGGLGEAEGITRRGILKGIGAAAAAGAAGKASAIAGAIPTPSHQQAMYKAAADSNRAMAAQEVERQRRENAAKAAKLNRDTKDVERLNRVNYHGKDSPKPSNATWDGDSDFMDIDGTQYSMASRMPISGDVPSDMKLIVTREGRQVYIWTRYRMKGDGGHYFYPAEKPNTIDEQGVAEGSLSENAEDLNIGDPVIIAGPVMYKGSTGEIVDFTRDKRFVVVNLYNHGTHSFHSADVQFNDYADSDDEEARMYDAGEFRNEIDEAFSDLERAVMEGGHELIKEDPVAPAQLGQLGQPTLGADLTKPQGQQDAQQQQQDQKDQQLAAQKELQQQATLTKGVNALKSAGAAVSNPNQVVKAFDKADTNQGLTPADKNSIASAGTVLAPIMANPQLQGKFKDLVTQASAAQKKDQQQQAKQPQQPVGATPAVAPAPAGQVK